MDPAIADRSFSVPDRGVRRRTVGFSLWLEYVLAVALLALFVIGIVLESYHPDVLSMQLQTAGCVAFAALVLTNIVLARATTLVGRLLRILLVGLVGGALAWAAVWQAPGSITQIGLPAAGVRYVVYVALAGLVFWVWGCWLWVYTKVSLWRAPDALGAPPRGPKSRLLCGVFDALFAPPFGPEWYRHCRLLSAVGHRVIDPEHPAEGDEYDERRVAGLRTFVVALSMLVAVGTMLELGGCRHETPKGILGGHGMRIARGRVPVRIQRKKKKQIVKEKKKKEKERVTRESILTLFKQEMKLSEESLELTKAAVADDAGLPDGQGAGDTAAGSPKGTKIGGSYYLYRVKYSGGWDANRKGIPALMREFSKVTNVKTNRFDQPVTLSDLPRHKEKYFPVLLYMTGNGRISVSGRDIQNLRDYLNAGGFIFADSSGGDFYNHFIALMRQVMPDKRFRQIAYDHTVFRGDYMPWQLREGCPIYRRHQGAGPAVGLFVEGRLAVFYSGGDLGAAWATVGWSRNKRRDVELAFRMGINVICYAMLYGGPKGLEDEK